MVKEAYFVGKDKRFAVTVNLPSPKNPAGPLSHVLQTWDIPAGSKALKGKYVGLASSRYGVKVTSQTKEKMSLPSIHHFVR